MPRPLVYGNGRLLIQTDRDFAQRDLFFPMVGMPNHLAGHKIRLGVWVDHRFAWCDNGGWHREMRYLPGSLVGDIVLENAELGVRLLIHEAVDPVHPVFARHVTVENLADHDREVRLFSTQDLYINETDIGDTALYHPVAEAMVHYKGSFAFLFGARAQGKGLSDYTTGIKAFRGHIGSWLDAEDGHLGRNPISQGSVDSTFSISLNVPARGKEEAHFWMICGHSLEEVLARQSEWIGDEPAKRIGYAKAYWQSWLAPAEEDHAVFEKPVRRFLDQSLLLVRTQVDNGGAILAANDSDIMETNRATYSFLWPRDGALVAQVLDVAGHPELSRRYFELCHRLLPHDRPMFLHKYAPDGTLGASWHPFLAGGEPETPFQEDESALTVWALAEHFDQVGDIERVARWYPRLVREICDFMTEFRDSVTRLPLPSWDLWEERRGVHAYTVATVVAGLLAGERLARALGDDPSADRWRSAAEETREAAATRLFDASRGVFHRMLWPDGSPDLTVDAATLSFGLFGVFDPNDEKVAATANTVQKALSVAGKTGGVARYQGDYYFRRTDDYPGNPWVICTHWLAQTRALQAKTVEELRPALEAIEWAMGLAESTGVLAEQFHPDTGEPLSVSPLTWSHAETLRTAQIYARRLRELK